MSAYKKSASEGLGKNPTDRGRTGTKLHLHVDGQGIPFGIVAVGANIHDSRLISQTIENSLKLGGYFLWSEEPHFCLDKGYDYERVYVEVYVSGFEAHIRGRGEEKVDATAGDKPRRWVVERTLAWLKGFRSIRTRYCRYLRNFTALLYFACACIVWRKTM